MHPILERQTKRVGVTPNAPPDARQWQALLKAIADAYEAADDERNFKEHALMVSSREMGELHASVSAQRDRLKVIIDSLDDGILVCDVNSRVILANPEAMRIFGRPEDDLLAFTLTTVAEMLHLDERVSGSIRDFLAQEFTIDREPVRIDDVTWRNADGALFWLSVSLIPLTRQDIGSLMIVLRDVSEVKAYEIELRHANKLEAVGQLASGIAHEINTPVQFVSNNITFFREAFAAMGQVLEAAEVLLDEAKQKMPNAAAVATFEQALTNSDYEFFREDMPSALQQSDDGMGRVATIVRAMKVFAHPGSNERLPIDLNSAIENTVTVAAGELANVATVEVELGDLPLVPCFSGDINQVILNLLVNASHAIADTLAPGSRQRGVITVRSYVDGNDAVIEVSDTGTGIPESARDHIFEPFFTTKSVGRGTGQGLALAHKVIQEIHQGSLTFRTTMGEGTTFMIRLPLSK